METITIDFLPAGATAVCHASQFDPERVIRMNLRNGGAVYTLSGSEIIKAKITRPDGTSIVENIENTASSYVDLVTSAGTCDVSGTNKGELVIEKDGATIGSKNFRMEVEEDPYGGAGGVVVESASGAIASFETDIEDELVELKAKIEPVQDLHGYTHPWTAGGGKNIYPLITPDTKNGITLTNDNGVITLNGTATADAYFDIDNLNITLPTGSKLYLCAFNPIADTARLTIFLITNNMGNPQVNLNNANAILETTITSEGSIGTRLRLRVPNGFTYSNYKLSPYLQIGGNTPTSFTPYSNICPISGHDEVNITHTGENLDDGETVTVTFGQTVYKGYLDAKNNRLILTFVLVDLGNLTWGHSISATRNFFYTTRAFEVAPKGVAQGSTNDDTSSEYRIAQYSEVVNGTVSSSFNIPNTTKRIYLYDASKTNMTAEEFTAAVAGVQLLYEIETPIEIPLSAIQQIETRSGENNVYNDTGDTSLKYYKRAGRATA